MALSPHVHIPLQGINKFNLKHPAVAKGVTKAATSCQGLQRRAITVVFCICRQCEAIIPACVVNLVRNARLLKASVYAKNGRQALSVGDCKCRGEE